MNKKLSLEDAKTLYKSNDESCQKIALRYYTKNQLNEVCETKQDVDYDKILHRIRKNMRTYLVKLNVPSPPEKCTQKVYDQWTTLVDLKLICAYLNQGVHTNTHERYRIVYDSRSKSFTTSACSNIADIKFLNDTLFVFERDAQTAIKILNNRLNLLING